MSRASLRAALVLVPVLPVLALGAAGAYAAEPRYAFQWLAPAKPVIPPRPPAPAPPAPAPPAPAPPPAAAYPAGPGPDLRFADPRGFTNGQVPADQLCRVPGARSDSWRMSCRAIGDFTALNQAYRARFGRGLQVDHLRGTAYRTVGDQKVLYAKYGSPRAATPGTSNHGWGLALDLAMGGGNHSSPTYRWLKENGPRYGFIDEMPTEDWHWRYTR
ncbi:M15 family metallopeptidase [Enemella evansiae]|uniref:M15 family metallopeptidase n=2 Tax=Enemella evansiae TaxID=2016499 RepID=UPI0015C5F5F4|nr:M15 family metallopeptidase [Enemella evansiae]